MRFAVWHAITSLGDSALLLPLMAWVALSLLLTRRDRPQGFRWIFAACLTAGIVSLSKLLFMGWGIGYGLGDLNYTGFSGHTAMSTLVWPALAGMLARRAAPRWQFVAISLGILIAGAIGVSRLAVRAHSPIEVLLGAALGLLVTTWFLRGLLHHARHSEVAPAADAGRRQLLLLGVGGAAIALLCYGRVFPSQHILQDLALWLSGREHVFTRRAVLH